MLRKVILLLLSGALILQCSNANNATGAKTDSASTTISAELSAEQLANDKLYYDRLKAIFRIIDEFYYLTYDVIRSGRKLFEDVLMDVQNSTTFQNSPHLRAKILELTEFNDKVDNFKPRQDYYVKTHVDALKLYFDQLDALNATAMKNPSSLDLLFDASLRNNRLETVKQASVLRLSKYLKKFSKQLNDFEEALNGREPVSREDVKAWILELHELKTVLVQISAK